MPLKYGDVVVKVQRLRDGSLSRVNAIVLATSTHMQVKADRTLHDEAEHLDLAYADPGLVPQGQVLKTRNIDSIFRLAYDVAPYQDGNSIGYEPATIDDPTAAFLMLLRDPAVQAFADSPEGLAQIESIMEEVHVAREAIHVEGTIGEEREPVVDAELERAFLEAQQAELDKRNGLPSAADLDAHEAQLNATGEAPAATAAVDFNGNEAQSNATGEAPAADVEGQGAPAE